MLNTLDFPEGDQLKRQALPIAKNILSLKKSFKQKKAAVIYVNDNFGKWHADWKQVFQICADKDSKGKDLAEILKPEEDDFFILKPRHSGFYNTNLETLLEDLQIKHLVITGIAGNICVLFTVNEAHMRGYDVWMPKNCVASNTKKENDFAIQQVSNSLKIRTSIYL